MLSGFLVMPSLLPILYAGQLYNCIFDFYLCLSRRSPFFPRHLLLTTRLQGFILGALANVHLTHQFGFGKVGIDADLKRFEVWC